MGKLSAEVKVVSRRAGAVPRVIERGTSFGQDGSEAKLGTSPSRKGRTLEACSHSAALQLSLFAFFNLQFSGKSDWRFRPVGSCHEMCSQ